MSQLKRVVFICAAWTVCGMTAAAFAQGVQTGTIRGVVRDAQDLAVPGVTVTVTSAALQGPRTVVTDTQGLYAIPALPAGTYTVKFELAGFATIERQTTVALGLTVDQNVSLRPAGVTESVQVVAETPAPIATPVVGANYKHEEIESLATPRTIQGIAQLAPALTTNSPNATQVVINGGFAYDNIFMLNGVDVDDNLFASPQNLFVEDAIEETQVLTSGISAEYGRFSGGVVNAITKSGSNTFQGSGRINFTNPSWSAATPFEVEQNRAATAHPNQGLRSYEGTFGGPILKDHLWFFSSGRYQSNSAPLTLPVSAAVVSQDTNNKRGSIKVTGSPASGHTIQGEFFNNPQTITNTSGLSNSFLIDTHDLITRSNPNKSFYANYRGILGNNLLAEAQYSRRGYTFNQSGPSGTSILDSPFFDINQSVLYNAAYFDANDPEERNNRQLTGNVTAYWSLAGRHETKSGYEWFRSQRTGGNSQSPTSYVFLSDFVTDGSGAPVFDSTGKPIPMFVPGESLIQYFPAVKGAVLNVDNNSACAGPLGHQRSVVGRPRRALRARESGLDRRHRQHRQQSHRAASRLVVQRDQQRGPGRARHVWTVFRPIQRSADRPEQSGRQSRLHSVHLSGTGGPGLRVHTGNDDRELPDQLCEFRGVGSAAERLHCTGDEIAPHARVLGLVRFESVHAARLRRSQLRLPQDDEPDRRLSDRRRRFHQRRRTRRRCRHVHEHHLPEHRPGPSRVPRHGVPEPLYHFEKLDGQRAVHASAQERRQLRG
jgi:hypothetical protein